MNMSRLLAVLFLLYCSCCATPKKPNIVFILTDDQDVVLGGMTPMTKVKKLIGSAGITFTNMFTTNPLCCPSRSSILTGNYVHNHGALNNSISGNCSSPLWQNGAEKSAFITYVKQMGYNTFFAGKYLNQYGDKDAGGVEHIPPGWDWWNGLVHNSVYYNYKLSVNGTAETHGHDYKKDYLTDLINNRAQDFLTIQHENSKPFFMMLSTPACHAPFDSAPQFMKNYTNKRAPRTASYNKHGSDKHWLVRHQVTPMKNDSVENTDDIFRKRWRTLLSVDDMVENVINTLSKKKLLNNTYIIYSSDNGYHLGQFSMPRDKRHLYEFDIRVPLLIRGPGIPAGKVIDEPVLNIDLAPTFIELSGHEVPSDVDGMSLITLLHSNLPASSRWRQDFLVEHNGEHAPDGKYPPCKNTGGLQACSPIDCSCEDAINNTYICRRTLNDTVNMMYCEFSDSESFVEMYNISKDPDQLVNIIHQVDPHIIEEQNERLEMLMICQGASCREVGPIPNFQPLHSDVE
uniref:N-acetylglucosamine-6-sulfatase-like n=1 Tax=Saccoglossus kowalevskii TaxID=10224 RepID=A0ABM0GK80_SACKO|nr:PREDICTED: N-acetylglucosamine-6-sulfatase-like [Saccoglossus kowalevskii]